MSSLFKFDKVNNTLVGAGLYADKNALKASGTFFLTIPLNDRKNYTLSHNAFEDSFLQEFLQKKNVGNNAGLNSTEIRNLILRKDGGALLVGERIETKGRLQNPNLPGGGRSSADFYYDQVFVASIHPSGKKHWLNVFQKKQYSFDDGGIYSSFFMCIGKKGVRMLFNDEIRTQSTISEFMLKGSGDYKRRAIINTIDTDIKIRMRDALQLSSNSIVAPSQYRNKLKMVKFSF